MNRVCHKIDNVRLETYEVYDPKTGRSIIYEKDLRGRITRKTYTRGRVGHVFLEKVEPSDEIEFNKIKKCYQEQL